MRKAYFRLLFKFVDICNYLVPGFSYAKYLTAYGCAQQKGHFTYEYMNNLCKLGRGRALPPQAAFFSRLTNEGIYDDDYAALSGGVARERNEDAGRVPRMV